MKLIEQEIQKLNQYITASIFDNKNRIAKDIADYLCAKSKRLRSMLVFLFTKAFGAEISDKVYHLACSVELIHNSTLIHDDILDNADTRRGKVSLNYKLGNNLSVLAGDLLLSAALKELIKCGNLDAVDYFSKSIYSMCKGEINQHFTIGTLPSTVQYIEKSEYKTAELFKASLASLCEILNVEQKESVISFAGNFGIAFQIKDDLLNILQTDKTKPVLSDIHNGIYTAPVIFLNDDIKNAAELPKDEIISRLQASGKYFNETAELIKKYAEQAISSIEFISDNEYKEQIVKITENLYKAGINE